MLDHAVGVDTVEEEALARGFVFADEVDVDELIEERCAGRFGDADGNDAAGSCDGVRRKGGVELGEGKFFAKVVRGNYRDDMVRFLQGKFHLVGNGVAGFEIEVLKNVLWPASSRRLEIHLAHSQSWPAREMKKWLIG